MNEYWMTFRVSGFGASDRRTRLIAALREQAEEQSWWDETDSYIMFRSGLDLAELRALAESVVGPEDLVLIGMVYFMKCEVIGKVESPALFQSLRYQGAF